MRESVKLRRPVRDPDYDWGDIVPPWLYAEEVLGLNLYDWQFRAMDAVGQRLPVTLAAANESGKTTTCAAPLILWFLDQFGKKGGKVVITSGSWLQLTTQFRPALKRYEHLYPEWQWNDTNIRIPGSPADYGMVMFSTDSPGRAEGHHAVDAANAPLFIIADEAKSIPDSIFTAFDRCGPQFLLLMSSPGPALGKFYRTHTKERSLYYQVRVTSYDCPHILPEKRARDAEIYGAQSAMFRSMHEAEFTDLEGRMVCPAATLTACLENPPPYEEGPAVAFCDFAAGGDECVLAIRRGNRVWIAGAWREDDTTQSCRRFVELFIANGLTPSNIFGDEGGMGVVFINNLRDMGWSITGVNNQSAALDPRYENRGSEMWHVTAERIAKRTIAIASDNKLFEQMTTRPVKVSSSLKLGMMSKKDMKEEGMPSPDRADAICGAIACGPHLLGAIITSTAGIRFARPTFSRPSFR